MHETTNRGWWRQNIFLIFPVPLNTKCDARPSNLLHGGWQHGQKGWRETASTPVKHHRRTKIMTTAEEFLWLGTPEMWFCPAPISRIVSISLLLSFPYSYSYFEKVSLEINMGRRWRCGMRREGAFSIFCLSPSLLNDINTSGTAERKPALPGRLSWLRNRKQPQRRCMEQ